MKRTILAASAVFVLIGFLTACSGGAPLNPDSVDVTVTTEPAPAAAGSPVKLKAQLAGVPSDMASSVTFDIRAGELPELIDAVDEGGGLYTGTCTFPEAGVYDVFLHLYIGDLHLTKKRQVEVQ